MPGDDGENEGAAKPQPNYIRVLRRTRVPAPEELAPPCSHLAGMTELREPTTHVCRICVEQGDTWLHLRMCLECGEVSCCDSSPNKHATAHNGSTAHPVIRGIEPGERWVYCYEDAETFTFQG
jgi:uncharacterized UBP type Zn finger protein